MTCPTAGGRLPSLAFCFAIALAAAGGCGKKGPPLAPLVIQPAAPGGAAVRVQGEAAAFQFRVPDANADNTKPADVARVEVYGYTGRPASDEDLLKLGTRVASVPVQRPPDPDETGAPEPAPPPPEGTFSQGEVVVVREPLGPQQRSPVVDPKRKGTVLAAPAVGAPLQPPVLSALPTRVYAAVAVSRRGRRGPVTEKLPVPLVDPPPAPPAPQVSHDDQNLSVRWTAPAGLPRATILPAREKDEVLPAKALGMPSLDGGFNVYLVARPDAAAEQGAAGPGPDRGPMPSPLNTTLLQEPRFEDPALEFGKERCYVVRAVSVLGGLSIESEASPVACLTPADTFPPAAPGGLSAVGSEGAISLIWEGNSEADLQGYLVLRGEAGGNLVPLTPEPIKETTYRDGQVKAGVRYTYAVVAVDTAGNGSEPSARIEETAR